MFGNAGLHRIPEQGLAARPIVAELTQELRALVSNVHAREQAIRQGGRPFLSGFVRWEISPEDMPPRAPLGHRIAPMHSIAPVSAFVVAKAMGVVMQRLSLSMSHRENSLFKLSVLTPEFDRIHVDLWNGLELDTPHTHPQTRIEVSIVEAASPSAHRSATALQRATNVELDFAEEAQFVFNPLVLANPNRTDEFELSYDTVSEVVQDLGSRFYDLIDIDLENHDQVLSSFVQYVCPQHEGHLRRSHPGASMIPDLSLVRRALFQQPAMLEIMGTVLSNSPGNSQEDESAHLKYSWMLRFVSESVLMFYKQGYSMRQVVDSAPILDHHLFLSQVISDIDMASCRPHNAFQAVNLVNAFFLGDNQAIKETLHDLDCIDLLKSAADIGRVQHADLHEAASMLFYRENLIKNGTRARFTRTARGRSALLELDRPTNRLAVPSLNPHQRLSDAAHFASFVADDSQKSHHIIGPLEKLMSSFSESDLNSLRDDLLQMPEVRSSLAVIFDAATQANRLADQHNYPVLSRDAAELLQSHDRIMNAVTPG